MNLYCLRHGIAVALDTANFANDPERPLTAKGERKLCDVAKAMEALELSFDLILSSPYVRARQTAQVIAKGLKARKQIEFSVTLVPGGDPKKLIQLLNDHEPAPKDVLLVGHEPHLSEFISLLVSGERDQLVVMKKGGLCKLAVGELHHGRCARLEWLLTPKQMALMA